MCITTIEYTIKNTSERVRIQKAKQTSRTQKKQNCQTSKLRSLWNYSVCRHKITPAKSLMPAHFLARQKYRKWRRNGTEHFWYVIDVYCRMRRIICRFYVLFGVHSSICFWDFCFALLNVCVNGNGFGLKWKMIMSGVQYNVQCKLAVEVYNLQPSNKYMLFAYQRICTSNTASL